MIKLYHFGPQFGVADPSPFCLKIDLYLRACGLEYEAIPSFDNLKNAPKGKLPYISDGDNVVCDSSFIIDYLKQKYGDSLDGALSPEQHAITRAFSKMLDENLYWCIVYSRWIEPKGWEKVKEAFFGGMPLPLKMLVPTLVRRDIKKALHGQGIGRHSHTEIVEIARKDIQALADLLGDKDYFLTDKVTSLDVIAYSYLAELTVPELGTDFEQIAKNTPSLKAFVDRITAEYYT